MKNRHIIFTILTLLTVSCSFEDMVPQGGTQLEHQVQETITAIPDRVQADVYGMYSNLGVQYVVLGMGFDCDFGYPAQCMTQDSNGPDMVCDNSNYNWFTPSYDYSDRNANYAVPAMRFANPYNLVKICNDIIASMDEETVEGKMRYSLGQAKAMRAFAYLSLAPYYQFNYADNPDKPCVPLVTEDTPDYANNPRATNEKIYGQMLEDLTDAIEHLEGYTRPAGSKVEVDRNVAYGLRARVNLAMNNFKEAAEDAAKAREGYTPASIEDVSKPAFCQMSEGNWMWGINIDNTSITNPLATWPSKLSSFSGFGYTTQVGCYKRINRLLYDVIDSKDVRKGWWVNEELESPLLENVTWNGVTGNRVAELEITQTKVAFVPYTNVKFGMKSGIGSIQNDSDWPIMRVEEMILIEAEGLARTNRETEAQNLLTEFVSTYRNPGYSCRLTGELLINEIWRERRVELWGEGFSMSDIMRLKKPVVRVHKGDIANWPDAWAFNVPAGDEYLLLRFPDVETNANAGVPVTENVGGKAPVAGQYIDLLDGVTD